MKQCLPPDTKTPTANSDLCPTCLGDGFLVFVGAPGYFSPYDGCWLPDEEKFICEPCHGTGEVQACECDSKLPDLKPEEVELDELPF
jgi:hypothetical protein